MTLSRLVLFQSSERSLKLEHISDGVVKQLKAPRDIIDGEFFVCYSDSPLFVTYRARVGGTSDVDSDSLISLIEEWVRGGGASVIVTGVLMTVDSHCSVAISSPSEPECSPVAPAPAPTAFAATSNRERDSTTNISAIIAVVGVIVLAIIAAITIVVVIIACLKLRNRRGGVTLKETHQR